MNRTTFTRNTETDEWSWTTRNMPNGEITGDAGGYNNGESALNGYLSQQGFPDWKPGDSLPEGYTPVDIAGDSFVIEQETP